MSEVSDPDDDNERAIDQFNAREKQILREVSIAPEKENQESKKVMGKLVRIVETRALNKLRDHRGTDDQN